MAGRKIIKPTHERAIIVDRVDGINNTVNTALAVVSEQLQKMALKSKASTFTDAEARTLQTYIKALVDLSREERERDRSDIELEKLKNLSDSELLDLAQKHLVGAQQTTKNEKV